MEKELLEKIKSNKKYKTISEDIVLNEIKIYLKKHPDTKINKTTISEIRKKLHRLYSSYQTKKKNKIQNYLDKEITQDSIIRILSSTKSTRERLLYYKDLYKKIFSITGKPKKIIDLGAGLNIFSFNFMNLEKLNYTAYDVDEKDTELINKFISITPNLTGKAKTGDITKINLPDSDIIFLFKVLDLVENKNKFILKLIKKTKFLIVSFATKTLSGKSMKLKSRTGFEHFLNQNNLKFEKIEFPNELFYVVKNY